MASGEVPTAVEQIVSRCLEKSRESRFQSARDLAFGLDVLSRSDLSKSGSRGPIRMDSTRERCRGSSSRVLSASLAGESRSLVAVEIDPPPMRPLRLSVDLGGDAPLRWSAAQFGNAVAISPDGSTIAFVGQRNAATPPQLYVRRLESRAPAVAWHRRRERAVLLEPDGAWLGFDTGLELKKVAVTGGAPILLAPVVVHARRGVGAGPRDRWCCP